MTEAEFENCKGCLYICECCNNWSCCSHCKPFGSNLNIEFGIKCKITGKTINEKHRFKVGDIVTVRNDLIYGHNYDNCRFIMNSYRGKQVTIERCIYNLNGRARYSIIEDSGSFTWSNSMFE